ncbi:GDSL-type esterase/lipase family protein [Brachybacterium paraconglomeratum]|uniref:GDSL-type esterase/lipase family protein n=1 Tax=Brachybacterium paraconglomeratum TaxID=173362 RepID=UPI0022AEA74B|nr:GDSL-type esterase/lipase family protein [Brachybacterium paraconglomeratum]MCZ4325216.1 GDSL-type esterase/lipase family protein [Brachybacterium paraconglomeratum]
MKRSVVLVLSLLLNVALLAAGGWYLSERGARPIAEDLGIVEERRPAYEVYAGERFTGLEGEATVLIGDSQVERGPWSEVLDAPVALRGQGGMLIAEVTATAPDTIPEGAERVIIWAGSNDALHERTPAEAGADMTELLAAVEAAAPGAELVVLSLPPLEWVDVTDTNTALETAAADAGATWVDVTPALNGLLADDGVHLTGPGYEVVADALRTP